MKAIEILVEGYSEQLEVDLQDLLAAAKGRGLSSVPTNMLVQQLQSMGHNINNSSIMSVLNGNPFVQTATPEQVNLTPDDEAAQSGTPASEEDNQARVSQMAQNAVDI
jgi:hypothetical protein